MNDEIKMAAKKSHAALQVAHPRAGAGFKSLLLTNPNYFGRYPEQKMFPMYWQCLPRGE
jgi:hypothetical protein